MGSMCYSMWGALVSHLDDIVSLIYGGLCLCLSPLDIGHSIARLLSIRMICSAINPISTELIVPCLYGQAIQVYKCTETSPTAKQIFHLHCSFRTCLHLLSQFPELQLTLACLLYDPHTLLLWLCANGVHCCSDACIISYSKLHIARGPGNWVSSIFLHDLHTVTCNHPLLMTKCFYVLMSCWQAN